MNALLLFGCYVITFAAVYYIAYKHGEGVGYDDGLLVGKKTTSSSTTTKKELLSPKLSPKETTPKSNIFVVGPVPQNVLDRLKSKQQ